VLDGLRHAYLLMMSALPVAGIAQPRFMVISGSFT
jgi:hypothetical protein